MHISAIWAETGLSLHLAPRSTLQDLADIHLYSSYLELSGEKLMAKDTTGRCKCGKIQYRGVLADAAMFRCYCRDCQQLTGTGHSEMVPLIFESFSINNSYIEYEMTGGSGHSTWSGFCPNCGSPLTRRSQQMNDRIYVHAASLDDPTQYHPTKSVYSGSAQPWDDPSDS